jgi:bifunctional non-homologous end joining protein LigD
MIDPIRPLLSREVPIGKEWWYEVKLDGFRGVLYLDGGRGEFRSKTSRSMPRFRELADGIARALPLKSAIFDGEIIVLRDHTPHFASLMYHRGQPQYAAFDLLLLNGRDLCGLPYTQRKRLLRKTIGRSTALGYVESCRRPELLEAASRLDLEGIVAKRSSDPYAPSTQWVKVKNAEYSQKEGRWEMFRRRSRRDAREGRENPRR